MNSLRDILLYILNHPLNSNQKVFAFKRFLFWQLRSLFTSKEVSKKFGEKSVLQLKKGMTGATGNYYCGLHEFHDMGWLLHVLRDSDLFIDIGANVGSYTVLAGSEVGASTISVEPIPNTFNFLSNNIALNNIVDKVKAYNIGLGSEKGIIKFTKSLDTVNHVATSNENDTIDVNVEKLDSIITLEKPTFIKMDVEGYESEVIKGGEELIKSNFLKGIIIELNGSGSRYGKEDMKIHEYLVNQNFQPIDYDPLKKEIKLLDLPGEFNTIYIRDIDFIKKRIESSRKYSIHNHVF